MLEEEIVVLSGGAAGGAAGGAGGPASATLPCPFCGRVFSLLALPAHSPQCPQLPARFAGASAPLHVLVGGQAEGEGLLTPRQRAALDFVNKQCRAFSAAAMEGLRARLSALPEMRGHSLERVLGYVRDTAPIIIHVSPEVLALLARDTLYRNQFETGTSKGTLSRATREQWERGLFNSAYDSAADTERVKYGCMNISGGVRGVLSAHGYGVCYLILKDSCRSRCTFTSADSSKSSQNGGRDLSTCESYAHILMSYTEEELRRLVAVALGGRGTMGAGGSMYKECQVHGPVRLGEDLSAVVVPEALRAQCQSTAEAFTRKHGVSVLFV